MICCAETADSGAYQPEERRGVFCVVEEVSEVEGEEGKVVGCVYAGVDLPQKPLVVVEDSLADCCVGGKSISIVAGAENGGLRSVDIVAFVKFPFKIR